MRIKFYLIILCMIISGCASTQGQTMSTQMQLRVGELERQLDIRNDEITGLQQEVKDISYELEQLKAKMNRSTYSGLSESKTTVKADKGQIIRVGITTEQAQQALQRAGYYKGPIDGKVGAGTKRAIESFQRDKGLKADGIIGQKTWVELQAAGQSD